MQQYSSITPSISAETQNYLQWMTGGNLKQHEVRVLGRDESATSHWNANAETILAMDTEDVRGIYITLNPAASDHKITAAMKDTDVWRRRNLIIDIDAIKPKEFKHDPSTEAEHAFALEQTATVRSWLEKKGFPAPMQLDTGNGYCLLVGLDFWENDRETAAAIKRLFGLIQQETGVHVDTTMHNASRITRIPGTMNRKGVASEERPYRPCRVMQMPERRNMEWNAFFAIVGKPESKPERTAGDLQITGGINSSLEVFEEWLTTKLAAKGINIKWQQEAGNEMRFHLDRCPVSGAVSESANDYTVFYNTQEKTIGYHNFHDHGSDFRWNDCRKAIDPDYTDPNASPFEVVTTSLTPVATEVSGTSTLAFPLIPQKDERPRRPFQHIGEILRGPKFKWQVKGIMPEYSFGCLWGPPGSLKTFAGIDIACAIVTRGAFLGHFEVLNPLRVAYVCSEGTSGLQKRLQVWMNQHHTSEAQLDGLQISTHSYLLDEEVDRAAFIEELRTAYGSGKPDVLIIDTLASNFGGDENSTKELGRLCRALANFAKEMKISIILIHHAGKDVSKGPRGNTSLTGKVDWHMQFQKDKDGYKARLQKQKDGKELGWFRIIPEELLADPTDLESTSLVIRFGGFTGDNEDEPPKVKPVPEVKKQINAMLGSEWVTPADVSDVIGCTPQTARKWLNMLHSESPLVERREIPTTNKLTRLEFRKHLPPGNLN